MEEMEKISKIKNSSKAGKTLSLIMCIICIAGCVCALVGGIVILGMGKEFDDTVQRGIDQGIITTEDSVASAKLVNINVGDITNIHSDVPAIQEAIDDHPYAIKFGTECLIIAVTLAVVAVLLKLINGVFDLIIKEDSPFTDKVIKRTMVVLIAVSVAMFFTTGAAFGVLGAIVTWVVYSIMDYGKTLQIQSDETL